MADFLLHILLADTVSKRIESRRLMEGVNKKRSLYNLGAQGPDPLFFYDKFRKKGPLLGLGRIMHRQHTGEFLKRGFDRLKDVSYDEDWLDLAVYLCGFICHFTLDRLLHPYVYWATNNWIWKFDGTMEQVTHQQVEMALDIIYWKERTRTKASRVNTKKLIDIGSDWPKSVSEFLTDAIENIYGMEVEPKELKNVLSSFYRGHDLLYDPAGWKKALINWLENLTGGGIKAPRHPYPAEYDTEIDWANRKRRTWKDPFGGGQELNESVDEILTDAEHAAVVHINTLFSRIYRNENIDNLLPDLSYITGQPCTYDEKE
ncbi:MAG: zinc dependent phospholipase C family protein [Clostridiaceae bacterium]|nr:zinc dependent phospholipase C family protein [Clostridiaceae bacterium]